jgi:uncharacterized membrane protein
MQLTVRRDSSNHRAIPEHTWEAITSHKFVAALQAAEEHVMSQKQFWGGVAVGSGAVIGVMYASGVLGQNQGRIIRIEKSVQIGANIENVFREWAHFERIPQYCRYITHVRNLGVDRSEWTANIDGHIFQWQAEVTQVIPNQVIGWKSVGGSRHSGRITFAPIGGDTLVHVQMNYVPSSILARPMLTVIGGRIEGYVEQALRDFKSELEILDHESEFLPNEYRESAELLPHNVMVGNFRRTSRPSQVRGEATGTLGTSEAPNANPVYGSPDSPTVDYTRPPDENSLRTK